MKVQVQNFRENLRKSIDSLIRKLLEDIDSDSNDYKERLQVEIEDLKEKRKAITTHLVIFESFL
jgi:FtsZ-binding cell division protein ZapB